ncbi:butyrophilin-like protein 10 isoform X2 [Oreochromis aureus]|uniref:Ig-like domain-containing protein n=1 Tax=Oreochromis aureus TaxID=47969 RepID=A0A668S8Z2_OREAU|nr:butyrophilin-like protein 10 isoform X2 [Oreochromis aureus]
MELLPLLFLSFCFLTLSGLTFGAESASPVIVMEDDDVILPCSLSTNENIESMLFVWKKEGTVPRKEVFMYDAGTDSKGQDEEFKGRVSHFPEQLKHGNASIRINKTTLEDNGNYTCSFPIIQSSGKTFRIELVVGAAPQPSVTNLDQTNDWALLQCDVQGAYPKPTVEWWNSNNQTIPSEEPQVSKNGERFYVTLKATVRKIDRYRCVATQKEIHHQIYKEINVHLNGAAPKPYVTMLETKGQLECEVLGASPKPTVEWWDNNNKTLHSKMLQYKEEHGLSYITIQTTVTKPGCYRCVATQMDIGHQIPSSKICVHDVTRSGTGMTRAALVSVIFGIVGILASV